MAVMLTTATRRQDVSGGLVPARAAASSSGSLGRKQAGRLEDHRSPPPPDRTAVAALRADGGRTASCSGSPGRGPAPAFRRSGGRARATGRPVTAGNRAARADRRAARVAAAAGDRGRIAAARRGASRGRATWRDLAGARHPPRSEVLLATGDSDGWNDGLSAAEAALSGRNAHRRGSGARGPRRSDSTRRDSISPPPWRRDGPFADAVRRR